MIFGRNSPRCIKTDAAKVRDYYCSLPAPILGSVLPSQPKRSVLQSLGLAAVCKAGRPTQARRCITHARRCCISRSGWFPRTTEPVEKLPIGLDVLDRRKGSSSPAVRDCSSAPAYERLPNSLAAHGGDRDPFAGRSFAADVDGGTPHAVRLGLPQDLVGDGGGVSFS